MQYFDWPEPVRITATIAAAIGLGASTLGATVGYVVSHLQRRRLVGSSTTEGRISSLISSLKSSADTLSKSITALGEIEGEMGKKRLLANKLQREIDHSTRIAALTREEVDAVTHVMGGVVRREGRRSFWKGLLINFVFFAAGVITTVLLAQAIK